MNNESKDFNPSTQQPSDGPLIVEESPGAAITPWEEYLSEKNKISPGKFLAELVKGPIPVPDNELLNRLAARIIAKPPLIRRLILLMQTSATNGERIQCIVDDMAEGIVRRTNLIPLPETLAPSTYHQAVSLWLEGIPHKPLKAPEISLLLLLLSLGYHRQLLDHDTSIELLSGAVVKQTRGRPKRTHPERRPMTPLDVVLSAAPALPILATLAAHTNAWRAHLETCNRQLAINEEEISRLNRDCAEKDATIAGLREAIDTNEIARAIAATKIAELEKKFVDLGDGWQHRLDEVRGRMRGVLSSQLTRWIQTALDASCSNPPFTKAVEERLQDALRLIEGELKWLQRLD